MPLVPELERQYYAEKPHFRKKTKHNKETTTDIVRMCFCFNPRCGNVGCFRLSAAAGCDLPLVKAWFSQLQIVSVTVGHLEF